MKTNILNTIFFAKRFAMIMAVAMMAVNMWGTDAVITFASQTSGTSDGSSAYTTDNFVSSGITSSDAAFGTISCSATTRCYSGKTGYGLKAGASSYAGSFTLAFSNALPNVTSITLDRASYLNSNSQIKPTTITVKNGLTTLADAVATPSESADFSDMSITDLNIESLSGLTVETGKYCYIKSITITYSNGYAVTYNNGGHGTAPSNTSATSLTLPSMDNVTGYTFLGWKANEDVTNTSTSESITAGTLINAGTGVTLSEATTFTAQWEINKYTVSIVSNNTDYGTVNVASVPNVPYGTVPTSSNNTVTINGTTITATPTTADADYTYAFSGWSGVPGSVTEACTITANFTRNARTYTNYRVSCAELYTITYDANGATGDVPTDDTEYEPSDDVTVAGAGNLAVEHYAFAGWNTKADGQGTAYAVGATLNLSKNTTLFAQWTCDEKVSVSAGTPTNGSFVLNSTGDVATCDGQVVITVTPNPSTGYEFSAITQTGSAEGTINQAAKTVTFAQYTSGTSTINVTFAPKTSTITWNANGGSVETASSEYIYNGATVEWPTPTREHYDFAGWWTAAEGGTQITEVGTTNKPVANVEYYAHWTIKNYTVKWSVNGDDTYSTGVTDANNNADYNTTVSAPTDPDGGVLGTCANTFIGWSKKHSGSVPQEASYYDDLFTETSPAITEATTFYAVFATQTGSDAASISFTDSNSDNSDDISDNETVEDDLSALTNSVSGLSYYEGSKIYAGTYGLKLGASGGAGSITFELSSNITTKTIKVNAKKYNNDTGTLSVTVNGDTDFGSAQGPSSDGGDLTFTAENAISVSSVTIATSTKRAYVKSITIGEGSTISDYVTECPAVIAPTLSVATGTYNEAKTVQISNYDNDYMYFYTTDGSNPAADANLDPTGTSAEYDDNDGITIDKNCTLKVIAYNDEVVASAITSAAYVLQVPTPTISGTTAFLENAEVMITCEGADHIYYTLDGSDPTNESAQYTAPFTVDATTTIKAIAVKANWTNSEIASQTFTKITPMTVAQARSTIDAAPTGTANQFVKGIISQIDSYNSTYSSITYWISDDGTTTNQLQVYSGLAGVVKEAFEATTDINVGEEVIVNGTLKKHNSTYEFDYNNTIVAYRPFSPIAWSANAYTAEIGGSSNVFPSLSGTAGLTISYSSSDETVATISADGTTYDLKKVGSTTITATSEANASYVATTKSYTLTVEEAVVRYSLSYEKNGGTSDATDSEGETETNLPDPLPTITKAGYNFGGWYLESTFENLATAGAALTENTTLYAKWDEPFTIAQALTKIAALDDNGTTEAVYVRGEVTDVALTLESGNTATYIIKDAGESNSLKVYKGKGKKTELAPSGENITEASYLQEGDAVVLYGQLMKYVKNSTTTPEVTSSFIYSFNRPTYDVTGVTLPSTANVRAGKTITLTATITPSNATNQNVTWSVISGDTYAEVSNTGVVTGVAEGTATITVTTHDGGFQATCTVTVAGTLPTFTEDDHEWIKVSNASKLVAGRFYVIGESSKGVTATNDLSSGYLAKASTTITDGVIASGSLGTNTAIFELGGNATDGWTLYELTDEENTGYLSGTNTSSLSWSASAATTSISFDESGNAILGNANGYRVLYNSSSPRFKGYDSNTSASMLLPQLYMWAELSHSVTFDANGGDENSVPDVERTDEGSIIIPATVPTHSDVTKAFAGWYEESAPSVLYTAGNPFSTSVDVTLYAKWNTVPTYTVTYVPGGTGTGIPAVASYPAGRKVLVATVDDLSNPGYLFTGWVVKDADQNVLDLDEENKFTMPASNVTITAGWSRESSQKWALVKYGETLDKDAEYIIACTFIKDAVTKTVALGDIVLASSNKVGQSVDVRRSGDIIKGSEAMVAYTLVTGNGGSNYAFQNGSNYLTWSSGNTLDKNTTLNNASSWTIEFDEENNAVIKNVGDDNRVLQYNSAQPRFACYTSTQTKIQLYRKVLSAVVTAADATDASIPNDADVTVKDGGVLTIGNNKQIGDLNIEAGGKVVVDEDKLTVVGTFSIETTMASGKSGQLNGATASNFEAQQEAYIDITLGANGTNQQWHAFTVPFPVDVMNGVYDLAGNKLVNETNYAIMEYLGDVRATGAYGWKKIRTTLVPGTFYIMATDGYRTTYRFKKKAGEALVATNSKAYYEYASSTGKNDNGWNGIGNPNLFYGKVDLAVQVLDPSTYTYVTKTANSTNFVVGTPFFYQAASDGSMSMETADADANYAPARVQATEIKDMPVSFGNEDFTDYLYVSANEDALNQYETGKDLAKMTMTNTPKVAQIFGNAYDTKLCMINTPLVNDQAKVALDLYAPKAGEYTIAADENANATVYLTYDDNIIWDLTMSAYTGNFAKGSNTGYGLLLNAKMPQTPTGVDNVQGNKVQCTKVILDEKVFILRGGQMYDVTGKAVK